MRHGLFILIIIKNVDPIRHHVLIYSYYINRKVYTLIRHSVYVIFIQSNSVNPNHTLFSVYL